MKKILIILVMVINLFSGCKINDSNVIEPIIEPIVDNKPLDGWVKTFGGDRIDEAQSIQQTSDGGYIVAGYTGSKGNGDLDVWLMKLDETGNEIWDRTFGGAFEEKANSVQQTSEGGYIICGYTTSSGNGSWDVWLIKTDVNGKEEWNQIYGGSSYDIGYSVIQTRDGGYMIAGLNNSQGDLNNGWIIKTDSKGKMEWDKIYGGPADDFFFELQQTTDGKYVFTGATDTQIQQNGTRDLWLLKTDTEGNMEWSKTFDGNNDKDFGRGVQETSDGGFLVTGNKRHSTGKREIWLLKTDSYGDKEWDKVLSDGKDALSRSIQPTTDGGFVISGFIDNNDTGDMDFCLIKIDNSYNRQWLDSFGKSNQYEEAFSAHETTDGGYIIAGFTTLSENNKDFYIVKKN